MAKDHLFCDDTELIVMVLATSGVRLQNMGFSTLNPGDARGVKQYEFHQRWVDLHLRADEIRRIYLSTTRRRILGFITVGDDCIVIERFSGEDAVISRHRESKFFDDYIARLRRFAERNGVHFLTEAPQ